MDTPHWGDIFADTLLIKRSSQQQHVKIREAKVDTHIPYSVVFGQ